MVPDALSPPNGGKKPKTPPPPPPPPQSISALRSDAQHLAESIVSTASLSERVSRKVRQLDGAQSRVREALTHIDAAVGRAEAVEGLRKAMASDDYEAAAAAIAAFSDLEERFIVPAVNAAANAAAAGGASGSAARGDDRAVREQHEVSFFFRVGVFRLLPPRSSSASFSFRFLSL